MSLTYAVGSLVKARGREWVVQPGSEEDFLILQPLGGRREDVTGLHTALERVESATFPLPTTDDLGDARSARLLRTALRLGFRSTAGPFRSIGSLSVQPRAYQFVPLMIALQQSPVRLLIADDVGVGKTVEAGLVAAELMAQGDVERLTVLCGPALAEQWQRELGLVEHNHLRAYLDRRPARARADDGRIDLRPPSGDCRVDRFHQVSPGVATSSSPRRPSSSSSTRRTPPLWTARSRVAVATSATSCFGGLPTTPRDTCCS